MPSIRSPALPLPSPGVLPVLPVEALTPAVRPRSPPSTPPANAPTRPPIGPATVLPTVAPKLLPTLEPRVPVAVPSACDLMLVLRLSSCWVPKLSLIVLMSLVACWALRPALIAFDTKPRPGTALATALTAVPTMPGLAFSLTMPTKLAVVRAASSACGEMDSALGTDGFSTPKVLAASSSALSTDIPVTAPLVTPVVATSLMKPPETDDGVLFDAVRLLPALTERPAGVASRLLPKVPP